MGIIINSVSVVCAPNPIQSGTLLITVINIPAGPPAPTEDVQLVIRNSLGVTVHVSAVQTLDSEESYGFAVSLGNGVYNFDVNCSLTPDLINNQYAVQCSLACDLDITSIEVTPNINGTSNGTATINAVSSYPIEYSLDGANWQSSNIFGGLGSGSKLAYVRDTNTCTDTQSFFIDSGACTISISSLTTTNETAEGANDGTVFANILANIGSVNYSVNGTDYTPSPYFGNLAPGNYTYYVRDSVNCIATYEFTIFAFDQGEAGFDPVPEDYLQDEKMTISYQPELNSFTAFHTYVPNHYVSRGNRVFMTINESNNIWELNKGLKGSYFNNDPESPYKFSITLTINPFPSITKVFDNFVLLTNSKNNGKEVYTDTFNTVQVWDLYQNSGEVTLVIGRQQVIDINNRLTQTKAELVSNEFRISIPRNVVANANEDLFDSDNLVTSSLFDSTPEVRKFRDQMRDKFLTIKLTYNNESNYELDFIGIKSIFRAISR
jgi:hypothetical protein